MKKYTLLIFFIAFPLLSFTVEETVNNKENIVVEEVKEISEKKIRTNEYTLNLKFDKYFNKEFNHFVYLNKQTAIKSAAISNCV